LGFDAEKICKSIEQALLAEDYKKEKARDIAFHMTDWLSDFEEIEDIENQDHDGKNEE
jgi:hypothetical protein